MRESFWRRRRRAIGAIIGPLWWWTATGRWNPQVRMLGRPPILHLWGSVETPGRLEFRSIRSRSHVSVARGAVLTLGDGVWINQGVSIHVSTRVEIGSRTLVGDDVVIYDTSFHGVGPGEHAERAPVRIGADVWIGNGALILPGVTIGRGAVVAARSVVTRDIASGTVVAGSPARSVRSFDVPGDFRRS